jgi:hypothetical protein
MPGVMQANNITPQSARLALASSGLDAIGGEAEARIRALVTLMTHVRYGPTYFAVMHKAALAC